jgi:hypothetical protein
MDKSLHAEIIQEVKRDVKTNIYASTAQVIGPIFSKHFDKDPECDLPVLANVHRVARRAKHLSLPKNPLDMEFDMGNLIFIVYSEKNYTHYNLTICR